MKIAPLITLVALVGMGVLLWMQDRQIHGLRSDILLLRKDLSGSADAGPDQKDASGAIEIKRTGDIAARLSKPDCADIEGFAKALAEVDEWTFQPEDETSAAAAIQKLVAEFRGITIQAIAKNLNDAISAPSGNAAASKIAAASDLYYRICPKPSDEGQQKQAEDVLSKIKSTARRVEELRRLRYNDWVADQVQKALEGYYTNSKGWGHHDDALIASFVGNLGSVDTSYLDPAVSGIYQQVLTTTSAALTEPNRVVLAKSLNSTELQRKTPLDF